MKDMVKLSMKLVLGVRPLNHLMAHGADSMRRK